MDEDTRTWLYELQDRLNTFISEEGDFGAGFVFQLETEPMQDLVITDVRYEDNEVLVTFDLA